MSKKTDPMVEMAKDAFGHFLGGILDFYGFSRERQMQIKRFLNQQAAKKKAQR